MQMEHIRRILSPRVLCLTCTCMLQCAHYVHYVAKYIRDDHAITISKLTRSPSTPVSPFSP